MTEISPDSRLSHYRIVEKLGAGGMGEVWLAEDTRLKRKVALKLLPAELTADAERVRRFEQEAQAASALNHPNIITVHDIGECEAGRFIVMELVAGHTLRTIIAQSPVTETVLALGSQIARALSAAHTAGITHRDIKPDNIMVRDDGYVKVLDFGLARLRPATESDSEAATLAQQTTPGTVMGTVAYMSPEQARGERVSHPSDIFALGIVFYELATGRHPFKAETLGGYLHAITLQEPTSLIKWKPELPAALNDLILRMLSKDVRQRPTASEVAQTLQDIERHGDTAKRRSGDDETMMLPAAAVSAPRADEGFWVAVLPFKWRGANAELEALAEGLSEDIVTGLSRFSYLRVIARGSTLRFTSETSDVRAIGKELGARYVMEGSLRQAGAMLRVAVQLVDAATGAHLWAESYDRQFAPDRIFAMQDELVPCIVSTVADWYGVLPKSMSEVIRLKAPESLSPYEALLRFFGYNLRLTTEDHLETRISLEQAVTKSPGNADCWAMLANIYLDEYKFGYNHKPDALERALVAALRAVEAAPSNPSSHCQLAQVRFFRKEFVAFREAAERAIVLNPMDGAIIGYMGVLIACSGDWERGCELTEKAIHLNPHHPGWFWGPFLNRAYLIEKDYHQALSFALKPNLPGFFHYHLNLAAIYGQLGEKKLAEQSLRDLLALKPDIAATVREDAEMWLSADLVEHWIEGLRKAGLEIAANPEAQAPQTQILQASRTTETGNSIAVLPFVNISADEENEYFCDGLAEELLNALAKIGKLKVAARTSAFSFKGKNAEAREIGKTLNVNTVLEGSVRKSGHRIRINVQLVNAADGYQLWSERYDREMKEIFDVQDEITLAVVDALKVKLLGAAKEAVLKRHTRNAEAHEHYLRGLFYFNKFTPHDFPKAIECFNRAIAIDRHYASAFAGLANAYVEMAFFTFSTPDEWMPKAQEAVNSALALDDTLGEAHNSLAIIKMYYDRDYPGAKRAFKQALRFDGSANINMWYAWYLGLMGQFEESFQVYRHALELDPLSEMINTSVGIVYYWAGQSERAIAQLQKVLELNPHYSLAQIFLAEAYAQRGDFAAAAAMVAGLQQSANDPLTLPTIGYVYGKIGDQEAAQEILAALAQRATDKFVSALNFAQVYAGFRDTEQTLAWLEKACRERPLWITFVNVDPKFDFLRSDPRFQNLLQRMGFSPDKQAGELLVPGVDDKRTENLSLASVILRHTVGREHERDELRAAFNAANDGRGSLLCVAGEPGIGKTTLVEDFLAELAAGNQCTIARGRCSERLAGTEAYLPLLEALESLLRYSTASGSEPGSFATTMKQLAPTWYALVVPLSGDSEEAARLLAEVKAASQERMKRELASFLQAVAEAQPLVIFFDDLHWADVSTIDLLSFLAGKFDVMRVLIVTTYRPSDMLLAKHPFLQIKPDLQARGLCRELQLAFLTEAEIAQYLNLEFPNHRFPPEFPKLIHAKTEGSPLFMADLVRYLRDRGVIAKEDSGRDARAPRWMLAQTLPDIERELPESVRGMIERKIAQLSEEDRKLLTAASVQGYEFDSAVVALVLQLDPDEVEERLEKLERVFAFVKLTDEGEFPNGTLTLEYRFVHVLYQNALYAGLRVTRKAALSAAVANALEECYGAQSASLANELGLLWEAAREYARASDAFLQAARNAAQINAHREAVQLAERGLAALRKLPETPERDGRELGLQLTLGLSLQDALSWAAPETGAAFNRAQQLCEQMGDDPSLFTALFGITIYHAIRGEYQKAHELSVQILQMAEKSQSPPLLVAAHRGFGVILYYHGDFVSAHGCHGRALALDCPEYHQAYLSIFNENLGVSTRREGSWCLMMLGYSEQALALANEGIVLAEQTAHPFSLVGSHHAMGALLLLLRDWQSGQQEYEKVLALAEKYDLGDILNYATASHALTLAYQEPTEAALERAQQAIASLRAKGVMLAMTWYLADLGEVFGLAGRYAEGLAAIAEALALVEDAGERYYEAEIWRIKGELLLQAAADQAEASRAQAEAEGCYHQAIEIARRQTAKALELRGTVSLARLWQRQGKRAEARQMLAEIYGWFTEGFDTADLREAKALLDKLTASQR